MIDSEMIWLTLLLVGATLVLTGPGLWSEKWGWGFLKRLGRKRRAPDER